MYDIHPAETEDAEYEEYVIIKGEYALSLLDNLHMVSVNTFHQFLPMKSNPDVMLEYFFNLTNKMLNMRTRHQGGLALLVNGDKTKDVLCALSWHLPLHPFNKIHIQIGSIHLYSTDACYTIVNCYQLGCDRTRDILNLCCSHVQKLCCTYSTYAPTNSLIIDLEEKLKRLRDKAFGRIENSVPDFDGMKRELFTTWTCPMKQVSLLFMREMGEIRVNHTLVENVMRCEIGLRMTAVIS